MKVGSCTISFIPDDRTKTSLYARKTCPHVPNRSAKVVPSNSQPSMAHLEDSGCHKIVFALGGCQWQQAGLTHCGRVRRTCLRKVFIELLAISTLEEPFTIGTSSLGPRPRTALM